jgi:carboxyvinyl-carboxyphosphonate phosphorylmutase
MTSREKNRRLRDMLQAEEILVAPGAFDVLTAKIIQSVGFQAVYMTGYGSSASLIGQPDVGLLTMSEMVSRARNIAAAVDVPVVADGDTGYGNPLNVMRTIREYEAAGVSGIQLEDQVFPKKCGHMLGRKLIPAEEMVQKIRAAVKARQDENFTIVARTDARTSLGLDEALRRGKMYEDAGADVVFIESPEREEEMRQINEYFHKPTLANMLEGGRTPIPTVERLQELGFGIVIYCVGPLYVAAKAVRDYMLELKEHRTTIGKLKDMIAFEEFNSLIGLEEYRQLEKEFEVAE